MSTAVLAPQPIRRPFDRPLGGGGRPARPVPRTRVTRESGVRLTGRGRLMLVLALVALAFLALTAGQAALGVFQAEAGPGVSSTDAARTWVVQPGETLWSIAEQLDPNTDPRETVARIEAMNDLAGSGVLAGQEIFVPSR